MATVIAGGHQGVLQSTGVERDVHKECGNSGRYVRVQLVAQNLLLGVDSGWMTGLWTSLGFMKQCVMPRFSAASVSLLMTCRVVNSDDKVWVMKGRSYSCTRMKPPHPLRSSGRSVPGRGHLDGFHRLPGFREGA